MKSKVVSLSAISAGFIALALIVGAYIELADLFAVVIASVFITLPLYYKSYKGCFLCSLAGGVIAFLCSGFNILSLVFPAYFTFFGIYPIVKCRMTEKSVNKYVGLIIGLVWFIVVAFGCYFYYMNVMNGVLDGVPEWLTDYVLIVVALVAIIFYLIYDRFILVMRIMSDKYLRRIIK